MRKKKILLIKYNRNKYYFIFDNFYYSYLFQCIVLFKCKDKKLFSAADLSAAATNKTIFHESKTIRKSKIQLMLAAVTQQDGGEIL